MRKTYEFHGYFRFVCTVRMDWFDCVRRVQVQAFYRDATGSRVGGRKKVGYRWVEEYRTRITRPDFMTLFNDFRK